MRSGPAPNDDKPWSIMDIVDLTNHIAHGADLEETASFLCRSGNPCEVARKAAELGLKWKRGGGKSKKTGADEPP